MKGLHKAVMGAIIGAATAGVWLSLDLILPEPYGDYLLFILMGLVNMVIGWQVGRLVGKKDALESSAKGLEMNSTHGETVTEK